MIGEGNQVDGVVQRVLRGREDGQPIGLLAFVGVHVFVPKTLILPSQREDLDAVVGEVLNGFVFKVDEERRSVVIAPLNIGERMPPAKPDEIVISDDYLLRFIESIRSHAEPDNDNGHLHKQTAKTLLGILTGEDLGDDADQWERLIQSRRPKSSLR